MYQQMSNIAYVRVSTTNQTTEIQEDLLRKFNIEKWFIEQASAKDIQHRPQFQALMNYIREGDVIYITDFSRIARSTKDLLNITDQFDQQNIQLISLKENIDTTTAVGKLMLTMIGAINEFERENLRERQKEGIERAKLKGKYAGRKPIPKPKNWEKIYGQYKIREITAKKAYEKLGVSKPTFYNMIKKYEKQ